LRLRLQNPRAKRRRGVSERRVRLSVHNKVEPK
jgi:hypothetical protein